MPTEPPADHVAAVTRRRVLGGALGLGVGLAARGPVAAVASDLLGSTGLTAPARAATASLAERIEAWASALTTVPGCAVAALDGITGEAVTFATGARTLAGGGNPAVLFERDSILTIDSVTKQFTTTMLAQAVAGGLGQGGPLRLDSPIGPFLDPWMHDTNGPLTLHALPASITLQQLADYTSGLPGEPDPFPEPRHDYTIPELALWLSKIIDTSGGPDNLAFTPGTGYFYSDVAVDLLGFVLADQLGLTVAGTPDFATLVDDLLLRPGVLDLRDTSVMPTAAQQPRVATGYLYKDKNDPAAGYVVATKVNDPPPFFGGGGVLRSTADDMLRFLAALIDPPTRGDLDRAVPLAAQVYFHQDQPSLDLGLGWNPIRQVAGPAGAPPVSVFLKDGGGSVGCTALLGYSPQTRRALFFMTNVDGADVHQTATFIELLSEYSPAPTTPTSTTTTTTTATTPGTADPAGAADPSGGAGAAGSAATPVPASPRFTG